MPLPPLRPARPHWPWACAVLLACARQISASPDATSPAPDATSPAPDATPPTSDATPPATTAARAVAPLSTATVFTARPALQWWLPPRDDGAQIEICHDRACARVVTTFDAVGTSATPPQDLPAGAVFWRVRGRSAGVLENDASPAWELIVRPTLSTVPRRAAASGLDVNADGYSDVIVGAYLQNRAYVYFGGASGTPSNASQILVGPDGATFGSNVSVVGDVDGDGYDEMAVAAYEYASFTGRVYVYHGEPLGLSADPMTTLTGPDGESSYFSTMSPVPVGDVNADGYADLIIGADGVSVATGRAYLYLGSATGLGATPIVLPSVDGSLSHFGSAVSGAGDFDGDGVCDVAAGDQTLERVYIYPAGWETTTPSTTIACTGACNNGFGRAVVSAGDVDGDGYADLLVGNGGVVSAPSSVHVIYGSATGLDPNRVSELSGPQDTAFGFAVARAEVRARGERRGDGTLLQRAPAARPARHAHRA